MSDLEVKIGDLEGIAFRWGGLLNSSNGLLGLLLLACRSRSGSIATYSSLTASSLGASLTNSSDSNLKEKNQILI